MPKQKNGPGGQIVLLTLPEFIGLTLSLGRKMMAEVREADGRLPVVLLIVDVTCRFTREDHFVLDLAKKHRELRSSCC